MNERSFSNRSAANWQARGARAVFYCSAGSIGASALRRGRAFYRHRVRKFTTLDLSPEQVHQIGLAEVKRVKAEMEAVIQHYDLKSAN